MKSFAQIEAEAREQHPDLDARLAQHAPPKSAAELADIPDDRWLSLMTRSVFQAGFVWKVIEAKWDGFEAAFDGFDPARVAFYSDEDVDRLLGDERIVRNGQKIMATIANAGFVSDIATEHGGFGRFIASWPVSDQAGLLDLFKTRGSRLAGMTGQYVLRFAGWDAWILSKDVSAALVRAGIVDKPPTSKSALAKVQAAFDQWRMESGKSQSEISRILAMSVG
ncbi:DNA-3-methyladenine glycosylase I [Maricaulis parjimensis]|uniref:DNA-3-methyladenine glycosylase I n=1 Tax=Maricaulis parjimensis TaxID=144023 RepID=UPI001939B80B|nr:DNA-3-methyladenine glycosylase I [Maricaulis parjimensis]